MAAAVTLTYASGNASGRIGIDTIQAKLTGLTSGTWYDVAVARPDGIGGARVQSAADGTAQFNFIPQMIGAYTVTIYPTNYTVGSVPQPGVPQASVQTTTFNVSAVGVDGGMAYPTATVSGVTLASSTLSA